MHARELVHNMPYGRARAGSRAAGGRGRVFAPGRAAVRASGWCLSLRICLFARWALAAFCALCFAAADVGDGRARLWGSGGASRGRGGAYERPEIIIGARQELPG